MVTSQSRSTPYTPPQLERILRLIEQLERENQNNGTIGVKFSRACASCAEESPEDRFAALNCGHVFCHSCTEGRTTCPVCDATTTFLRLFEQCSRECEICLCTEPMKRGFFSACGHVLCDACIGKMWYEATINKYRFACTHCQQRSRPVKLKEQKIQPVSMPFRAPENKEEEKPIAKRTRGVKRKHSKV